MPRNRIRFLLCAALLAGACFAQTEAAKPPASEEKFFHLDFAVKEVEGGKAINSRSYTMTVSTMSSASTRNGSRVPVSNGPGSLQVYEVGTNLDCRGVKEISTGLAFVLSADITSLASETGTPGPVIRTIRWSSPVIVTLRKPTTVFTSDDPSSKRQFQLEVTATPIK